MIRQSYGAASPAGRVRWPALHALFQRAASTATTPCCGWAPLRFDQAEMPDAPAIWSPGYGR